MPRKLNDLYTKKKSKAVLLINLGTPCKPTFFGVYRFLSQFLSDKRVIPLSKFLWWPILHFIVLPLRCRKVSQKYTIIWKNAGSPLLVNMQSIANKLQKKHNDIGVYLGMRYGEPSLQNAVDKIAEHGYEELTIIPMFPQYSDTTSGTALFATMDAFKKHRFTPSIKFIHDFCNKTQYIQLLVNTLKSHWSNHTMGECLIISFHGLPDESFELGDPYKHCCMQTAECIKNQISDIQKDVHIVFQSRFGPKKWLQPYAEQTIQDLAKKGITTIDVIAPSFYVDCLETLEEIKEGYHELFLSHGGKTLNYIPCLNDSDQSIALLSSIIEN